MGIHEDARQGTLVRTNLAKYLEADANSIHQQDPLDGMTPLALATIGGHVDVVKELLRKGAKADAPSRNGATPLLLAAWKANENRARIIQLLLEKTPPESVDATCELAANNTPLMYVITKTHPVDIESIRLLRKAGASLILENAENDTAEELALITNNREVKRAIYPDKEEKLMQKLVEMVLSFLLYVVAVLNRFVDGVLHELYELNPNVDPVINKDVNPTEPGSTAEFLANVNSFIEDSPIERFFKGKPFIKELAEKAAALQDNPDTPLCEKDLLPKTINVSLHQQVVYCDDSSSMRREGRFESQKRLVERITRVSTMILPEGEGVALRFINQNVDNADNLSFKQIGDTLNSMTYKTNGETEIGTNLKTKILEPMIYSKLETQSLERPLLISIITDGQPSRENPSTLIDAIKECGDRLEGAGYPRESVKFLLGQIGSAKAATKFLEGIRDTIANSDVAKVMYCTSARYKIEGIPRQRAGHRPMVNRNPFLADKKSGRRTGPVGIAGPLRLAEK
ncbi:hypothetical protein NHQ30_008634 [Ciborinia camelliae]|nr:hypothetical protein NHQ30_008634 [Ciborinia camelliae]